MIANRDLNNFQIKPHEVNEIVQFVLNLVKGTPEQTKWTRDKIEEQILSGLRNRKREELLTEEYWREAFSRP